MKLRNAILPAALLLSLPSLAFAERGLQATDLVSMDRFSSPVLSPDGRKVVFAKRTMDMASGKATTSLWIEDLFARDAAPPVRLTPEGWNVNSPAFSKDGASVYFLSRKNGTSQLYAIPASGGEPAQLTDFALDVDGFVPSPDGKRIAFAAAAFPDCNGDMACSRKRFDDKPKSSGVVYDRTFIRHWDTWADGSLNRIFVATLPAAGAKATTAATLVGGDLVADVPSKPFGDLSDLAWAPDGKSLVVSARLSNAEEPRSTNFDLYRLGADGKGKAVNLTAANKAWDAGPVFSDDGRTLYYRAMKRPGFEADRMGLMAMDVASGKVREIDPQWDRSADGIVLSNDGRTIYTTAQDMGGHPLFAVDIATGKATKAIGGGSIGDFSIAGPGTAAPTVVFTRNSMKSGAQVFAGGLDGAPERAITPSAGDMLPDVKWGDYEQFSFEGWNGDTVHGYVVKPWNYEEGKRYPVAFLIHGGPQGSFGDGWSYRWNPQTYAGQGYAVVMIDFHGSTGYGQAFTDAISQHWGDRPLEDLQKGWAAAQEKYAYLDGANACALGASYGGYMVYWIAGVWNKPWKCLVDHDGVFDNRMMGYATEELWFSEWENGGTPYDNPEGYEKFNPINHVEDWRVPMLVVHSAKDFRIPVSQGIAAFNALQRKGIESKFLYFPDENHWVLKPANSLLWHDTVNAWLREHIGGGTK
jgi:dipeptidyl aminopeptidase/acylaminoacyl peptidase